MAKGDVKAHCRKTKSGSGSCKKASGISGKAMPFSSEKTGKRYVRAHTRKKK